MESESDNSSYSSSSSAPQTRPNRWQGPASTWQSLTEQERGLAVSLNLLRNQDLGIHLYNSFALKKRAQKVDLESGKDADAGVNYEWGEWKPPKSWTAWPLKPGRVPRAGERIGPDDPDEIYTIKIDEPVRPSRELEDIMVGLTLKHAKERFESREVWVKEEVETQNIDEELIVGNPAVIQQQKDAWGFDTDLENSEPAVKGDPGAPRSISFRPVVSADDERSRKLLRPSIRHTLSKVDEVLEALHHARKTCHDYVYHSDANSEDGTEEMAHSRGRRGVSRDLRSASRSARSISRASSAGSARARGRPRKFANLTSRPKVANGSPPREARPHRSKSTHRGRPLKSYEPLENETQEEFMVRIARLQKKHLPAYAQPRTPEPPSSPIEKPPKRQIAKRATSEDLIKYRRRKLELRDWSEVLGAAAVVGFSPNVIARATQRCANLFGESMVMRNMPETSHGKKSSTFNTIYKPEEIPDFSAEELDDGSGSVDFSLEKAVPVNRRSKLQGKRVCPVEGCPRGEIGFRDRGGLRRHLRKGHNMTDDEVVEILEKGLIQAQGEKLTTPDSKSFDSDEEIEGAVHIDNFMREVRKFQKNKSKRKRPIEETRGRSEDEGALSIDAGSEGDNSSEAGRPDAV